MYGIKTLLLNDCFSVCFCVCLWSDCGLITTYYYIELVDFFVKKSRALFLVEHCFQPFIWNKWRQIQQQQMTIYCARHNQYDKSQECFVFLFYFHFIYGSLNWIKMARLYAHFQWHLIYIFPIIKIHYWCIILFMCILFFLFCFKLVFLFIFICRSENIQNESDIIPDVHSECKCSNILFLKTKPKRKKHTVKWNAWSCHIVFQQNGNEKRYMVGNRTMNLTKYVSFT